MDRCYTADTSSKWNVIFYYALPFQKKVKKPIWWSSDTRVLLGVWGVWAGAGVHMIECFNRYEDGYGEVLHTGPYICAGRWKGVPCFYTGKWDGQVRPYLMDDVCYHIFPITTAAEDFAMLRRSILSTKLQRCVSVAATSTVHLVLGHVHVTNAQKNFLLCHVFQGLRVLMEQIQVKILAGPFQIILKGLDSLP